MGAFGGIIALLVVVAVFIVVGGILSALTWQKQLPDVPKFAHPRPASGSLRTTVRKDVNASIQKDMWNFLWMHRVRYWFVGTGCLPVLLPESRVERFRETSSIVGRGSV